MASDRPFHHVCIIGLGLIGSSIARGIRKHGLADTLVGCDNNEATLRYARSNDIVDKALADPTVAAAGSDLVILATPPSSLADITDRIAPVLKPHALIMDTASVKQAAMQSIATHLPMQVDFVPAHPIAGSEESGIHAGTHDMFQRRRVVVTPNEPLAAPVMKKVNLFWTAMGARVEGMPAPMHDQVMAYVSHLPHLLAFAAQRMMGAEALANSAVNPRLASFLRIAASSPALWSDISLANRDFLMVALDRYMDAIAHIRKELAQAPNDSEPLFDDMLARTALFPRVAASCLITTIMEAEKKIGLSFARFTGPGFADFTAPLYDDPEANISQISQHYNQVAAILADYAAELSAIRAALAGGNMRTLSKALSKAN